MNKNAQNKRLKNSNKNIEKFVFTTSSFQKILLCTFGIYF